MTLPTREQLAEWFFDREAEHAEEQYNRRYLTPQQFARWPKDAAIQPYCRWAYREADAFLAYFK